MPIQHTIHENLKFVISVWTGPIADKDLVPAYKKLYEDKKWKPGFNLIADLRDADMSRITESGLIAATKVLEPFTKGKERKTALIAPNESANKFAWIYEVYTSTTSSPEIVKVFYNLSNALTWFGSTNSADFGGACPGPFIYSLTPKNSSPNWPLTGLFCKPTAK